MIHFFAILHIYCIETFQEEEAILWTLNSNISMATLSCTSNIISFILSMCRGDLEVTDPILLLVLNSYTYILLLTLN